MAQSPRRQIGSKLKRLLADTELLISEVRQAPDTQTNQTAKQKRQTLLENVTSSLSYLTQDSVYLTGDLGKHERRLEQIENLLGNLEKELSSRDRFIIQGSVRAPAIKPSKHSGCLAFGASSSRDGSPVAARDPPKIESTNSIKSLQRANGRLRVQVVELETNLKKYKRENARLQALVHELKQRMEHTNANFKAAVNRNSYLQSATQKDEIQGLASLIDLLVEDKSQTYAAVKHQMEQLHTNHEDLAQLIRRHVLLAQVKGVAFLDKERNQYTMRTAVRAWATQCISRDLGQSE